MTIKECADLVNADETTLYRHTKTGKFPAFTIAGMLRVNPAELAARIGGSSNRPKGGKGNSPKGGESSDKAA